MAKGKISRQKIKKSRRDWDRATDATNNFFANLVQVQATLQEINQETDEKEEKES